MRKLIIMLLAVLSILVTATACVEDPAAAQEEGSEGGVAGEPYAGMTRPEVRAYVGSKLLAAEEQGQGGILELRRIVKDENDAGRPVWLTVFDDQTTGGQLCLQTWATTETIHNSEPYSCSDF